MAHRQSGLTLTEVLLGLAVLGILALLAGPAWREQLLQRRLEGAAESYRQHFQWARSEAVRNGTPVRIKFERNAQGSCYVVFTGPDNACGCLQSPATCSAQGHLLGSEHLPAQNQISVAPDGTKSRLLIDPMRGTVSPTMTTVFSTADGRSIHQVVNLMGRVHGCSPNGALRTWPACKNSG